MHFLKEAKSLLSSPGKMIGGRYKIEGIAQAETYSSTLAESGMNSYGPTVSVLLGPRQYALIFGLRVKMRLMNGQGNLRRHGSTCALVRADEAPTRPKSHPCLPYSKKHFILTFMYIRLNKKFGSVTYPNVN